MPKELDGPRRSARTGSATSLVVLLHGYGASGDDLIGLADFMAPVLPSTAFAAPHAVEPLTWDAMAGYQWFPLQMRDPEEYITGTRGAAPVLDQFLDEELARQGVRPDRLALVGFSQGTMMALHVGLRRKVAPAAIVGLSGVIAGANVLTNEICCRPPVMLMHGAEDNVIPVGAIHLTREALGGAGVCVDWHVREGLGHEIDQEVVAITARFLAGRLG